MPGTESQPSVVSLPCKWGDVIMYEGFRFVGSMASIAKQREIEREILDQLLGGHKGSGALIDLGVGDGQELEFMLQPSSTRCALDRIAAVDIEDWLTRELPSLPNLRQMGSKVQFVLGDGTQPNRYCSSEHFDIAHGGFFFHEVPYGDRKERTAKACFRVLKCGGHLVYSDAFLNNRPAASSSREARRRAAIRKLYAHYLREADDALEHGRLSEKDWALLRGDGASPGLLKSAEDALKGEDDFYEPLGRCVDRLLRAGFAELRLYPNEFNEFLYVIVARKPL